MEQNTKFKVGDSVKITNKGTCPYWLGVMDYLNGAIRKIEGINLTGKIDAIIDGLHIPIDFLELVEASTTVVTTTHIPTAPVVSFGVEGGSHSDTKSMAEIEKLAAEMWPIDKEQENMFIARRIKDIRVGFISGYIEAQESGLNWRKIDPENLPENLVLAGWLNGTGTAMIGYLQKWELTVILWNDINIKEIKNPTHYIPISELLKLPTE